MAWSPSSPEEIPADDQHDADQHDEGVVVDIAGLQPPGTLRQVAGDRGDPVGSQPVDDGPVPALPEQMAHPLGRVHEQEVVELVEIPLVEEQEVDRPEGPGHGRRQARPQDIHDEGEPDAAETQDQRRQADPFGHIMPRLDRIVTRQDEQRLTPVIRHVMADEERIEDDAGEGRPEGQRNQRHPHHFRGFMDVMQRLVIGARRPMEGHEQQAPSVKTRAARRQGAEPEAEMADGGARAPGGLEDHVLGIEARESEDARDPDAAQGQAAGPHQDVGDGDHAPQPAHLAHVLLARHGMDDAAGAEEQQRFEEGMGEEVEDGRPIGGDSGGQEHVAQLTAGRIGDDALDVVLDEADGRREEAGEGADDGDEGQGEGGIFEHRGKAADHEDAGGHHGRRMDQSGDRGRPFHRIRQPGVEA